MNVWDWVEEYEAKARADGDGERLRMTRFHPEGYNCRETNPEKALALFDEGRRLAVALREPWWVLFFDHWRATAMVHFLRDFRNVLDLVVRTTLEVRKPLYEQHPLRLAVFDDLVAAYLGIDPVGYADPIRQAIDFLDGEIPREPDSNRYLLMARQRRLALELNDLDAAFAVTERELALADADRGQLHRASHFSVFVQDSRCEIAYRRGDLEGLSQAAAAGEELARRVGHQLELSELLLWQAYAARRSGNREAGLRLYRTATARLSRLKMPPHQGGFDAMAAYHEVGGDAAAMLGVRDQELRTVLNKGRFAYECRCRLLRCRLLATMGRPLDAELAEAREAATKLRVPGPYLADLDAVQKTV